MFKRIHTKQLGQIEWEQVFEHDCCLRIRDKQQILTVLKNLFLSPEKYMMMTKNNREKILRRVLHYRDDDADADRKICDAIKLVSDVFQHLVIENLL